MNSYQLVGLMSMFNAFPTTSPIVNRKSKIVNRKSQKGSLFVEQRLLNKVAIVTGAGQGIGKGIALRLAREGASVVIAE